jgi:hypothetical protein
LRVIGKGGTEAAHKAKTGPDDAASAATTLLTPALSPPDCGVEHVLLNIEHIDAALWPYIPGHLYGVLAKSRANLEDPLVLSRRERPPQWASWPWDLEVGRSLSAATILGIWKLVGVSARLRSWRVAGRTRSGREIGETTQ